MKLGTFSPVNDIISGVRIQRPSQILMFEVVYDNTVNMVNLIKSKNLKLSVQLQNSASGKMDSIVPFVPLSLLSQFSTYNEGCIEGHDNRIKFLCMLHPTQTITLGNDKYLDIEIHDFSEFGGCTPQTVTIYSMEAETQTDFITRYSKLSMAAGQSRNRYNITEEDMLAFPFENTYDEIQLTHKTGAVLVFTRPELQTRMSMKNDITAIIKKDFAEGVPDSENLPVIAHLGSHYILNLLDFTWLEVVRDSYSATPLEFITGNLVK